LFREAPERAVQLADELVRDALAEAGYAVEGSAAPPYEDMVEAYRCAHAIALSSRRGIVAHHELRRAMDCYAELLSELLEPSGDRPLTRDT
jgi:hypothetical protein